MSIGTAIFDLDGTLVDSVVVCTEIVNGMLHDRGAVHRVCTGEMRHHVSVGGTRMMTAVLGEHCADPEDEIREFRARYASLPTPLVSRFAGVAEGLAELHGHEVTLAICSNKPQNLCEKVLNELNLSRYFSAIVGSRPGMPNKPHPALFKEALRLVDGDIDRCCLVGDAEPDHHTALAMGVPFILVTYGYAEGSDFGRSARCDDFAAVPRQVLAALATPSQPQTIRIASSR